MENFPWIWLIALPLVTSPLVYLLGRISHPPTLSPKYANPGRWIGLLVLVATWAPLILAWQQFSQIGQPLTFSEGAIALQFDGISLLLAVSVLLLGTLVCLFSGPYLAGEEDQDKFYALLNAMVGAMMGLGCARDLFNLWLWFEVMAISSYMLVAFYHRQAAALEASVKYLVQSAAGSVLVLMGIALVFGETNQLEFSAIRAEAAGANTLPLLAAGALFIIGFGVKTALVPLHTWLPDAHSQAPSGISAMLSGVVIETGLVAMLRALGCLSTVSASWGQLLLAFGAINMQVGNLMALRQTQVKRLLAFSSLSHVGYMLVGLGAAVVFNQANGAQGGFFHLINHAIMKGLAFLAAGCLLFALFISRGKHSPLTIPDLAGASRRYPLECFALSVAVLGLGGLPPLAGFMSKWQIFLGGFETHSPLMIALVIFAALNSVLSLGYYAPLVNTMYRLEPSEAVQAGGRVPGAMIAPVIILVVLVVALGIYPTLISSLTQPAGAGLLAGFGY